MNGFLGIDLGTTGTKTILFDSDNNVLGKGYVGYDLILPFEDAYEQKAEDWYNAVCESVKTAIKDFNGDIKAVSFSAQGGSFLLADIDAEGRLVPLTNAFTWLDRRANEECSEISDKIVEITGKKPNSGSIIAKLFWIKKHYPDIYNRTKIILSTSDYIYYMITGEKVIDYTSAAMMGLFDNDKLCWDEKLLDLAGLNLSQLPRAINAGEFIGKCNKKFLSDIGVNGEIDVYCGVHDQFAASLGSDCFDNTVIISTGTTWVVFGKTDSAIKEFASRKHPDGGYGVFVSAISSGTVLAWEKNLFNSNYAEIDKGVENTSFDEDLLVYPFISGNGAYRGANNQKFSLLNVSYNHTRDDIARATMEGVSFEIKQILDRFDKNGIKISNVIVTGGATRSDVWMKILSTVLDRKLYLSEQVDGCCFGAYSVARKGFDGDFIKFDFSGKVVEPDKSLTDKYNVKFEKYNKKFQ